MQRKATISEKKTWNLIKGNFYLFPLSTVLIETAISNVMMMMMMIIIIIVIIIIILIITIMK